MRDHDHEPKDGAQGQPPQKAKTGGEQERQHKHADGHAPARPDMLRDERLAHPANAEPLAELLSQLQHSHGNAYVQRVVAESGGEKAQETKPAAESHAQGLDAATRSLMESGFGESFGDVRVHTGGEAERMNEDLGARAVTRGRDIYFGRGEYNPSTQDGKELLAHELTHVVQQRGGSSAQSGSVGRAGDAYEQEAERAAALAAHGARVQVERQSAAPAYQREGGGKQPQAQPAPPATFGLENITVSSASPSGTLSNGWRYRLVPNRPGRGDCLLDIVVPEGVSAVARSNRFSTEVHMVSESRGGVLRERAVVVSVLGGQGQSGLVAVTFMFEARGVRTTLGTVMFNLRP